MKFYKITVVLALLKNREKHGKDNVDRIVKSSLLKQIGGYKPMGKGRDVKRTLEKLGVALMRGQNRHFCLC